METFKIATSTEMYKVSYHQQITNFMIIACNARVHMLYKDADHNWKDLIKENPMYDMPVDHIYQQVENRMKTAKQHYAPIASISLLKGRNTPRQYIRRFL